MFKKIIPVLIISLFFLGASGTAYANDIVDGEIIKHRAFKFEIGSGEDLFQIKEAEFAFSLPADFFDPGSNPIDNLEVKCGTETVDDDTGCDASVKANDCGCFQWKNFADSDNCNHPFPPFTEDGKNATLALPDRNNQPARTINFFECVPFEFNPPSVQSEDDSLLEESFHFKAERVEDTAA